MLKYTSPIIIDSPAGDVLPTRLPQPLAPETPVAQVRSVIILTYPGCFLGEAIRLLELMTSLNVGHVHYVTHIYSLSGGRVVSPSSKLIHVDSLAVDGPIPMENDLLIIAHGTRAAAADPTGLLSHWLQAVFPVSKRIVAIGSGVLRLAAAGLLNHRQVTIHSTLVAFLSVNFPLVRIGATEALHIDGNIFTTNEYIDLRKLALLLIQEPLPQERVWSSASFPEVMEVSVALQKKVFAQKESVTHRIILWWLTHLGDDLTMKDSADFLAMSERSFRRHFKDEVGYNPYVFLLLLRLEIARQALMDGDLPIDKIARRAGLHDGQQLARMFRKFIRISPNQYRTDKDHDDPSVTHPLYSALFDGRQTPSWLRELLSQAFAAPSHQLFGQ